MPGDHLEAKNHSKKGVLALSPTLQAIQSKNKFLIFHNRFPGILSGGIWRSSQILGLLATGLWGSGIQRSFQILGLQHIFLTSAFMPYCYQYNSLVTHL